jgi:hypothetical protein
MVADVQNKTLAVKRFHEVLKENIRYVENILKYTPAIVHCLENKTDTTITDYLKDTESLYHDVLSINYKTMSNANKEKLGINDSAVLELNNIQQKHVFDLTNISIFIHFEFPGNKHWYEFSDDWNIITQKILSEFVDTGTHGVVLKKTLYKTLCSGDTKNDIQFPAFTVGNKYKSKEFQDSELQDLFYAVDYASKGQLIPETDIQLIVLPRGKNLNAQDYETFREKKDEKRIVSASSGDNQGDILFDFSLNNNKNITSFDLVFCKKGSQTSPDKDLIEISGIEKSKLRSIMERINHISKEIEAERKIFIKTEKELFPLKIDKSFRCILGNPQYDLNTGNL